MHSVEKLAIEGRKPFANIIISGLVLALAIGGFVM
jgi:hypothetical protein